MHQAGRNVAFNIKVTIAKQRNDKRSFYFKPRKLLSVITERYFFLFSLWRDQLASHQAPPVKSLVQLRLKRQTNSRSSVNFTRPHLCSPQRTTESLPCQMLRTLLWRKKILRFKSFLECLGLTHTCLLYTSPSPRDRTRSRMPSSA